MWVTLARLLIKILTNVLEQVVQWFLVTEIKEWLMKLVKRGKKDEKN